MTVMCLFKGAYVAFPFFILFFHRKNTPKVCHRVILYLFRVQYHTKKHMQVCLCMCVFKLEVDRIAEPLHLALFLLPSIPQLCLFLSLIDFCRTVYPVRPAAPSRPGV